MNNTVSSVHSYPDGKVVFMGRSAMGDSDLKTHSVPGLEKGLQLLEILAESSRGLTLAELVRKSRLPKSSIHCLVVTLERQGYVRRCLRSRRVMFAMKLFGLADRALAQVRIRQVAAPHLYALMRETKLTVHLAVLEQDQVVLIEKMEAPGVLKIASWIGRRMDIHCTGLGKALIAHLGEQEVDRLIHKYGLLRHNEHTMRSAHALKANLAEARKLKYAVDDEEDEIGWRCIAVPIFNQANEVVAAVSICGTVSHITSGNTPALAKKLLRCAGEISRNLSGDDLA